MAEFLLAEEEERGFECRYPHRQESAVRSPKRESRTQEQEFRMVFESAPSKRLTSSREFIRLSVHRSPILRQNHVIEIFLNQSFGHVLNRAFPALPRLPNRSAMLAATETAHCCPSHLNGQTIVFLFGKASSKSVDCKHKLMSFTPNYQLPKAPRLLLRQRYTLWIHLCLLSSASFLAIAPACTGTPCPTSQSARTLYRFRWFPNARSRSLPPGSSSGTSGRAHRYY